MKKVKFEGNQILVDGQAVGPLEGGGRAPLYIKLFSATERAAGQYGWGNGEGIARFKYGRSKKADAKHLAKFLLERKSPEEVLENIGFNRNRDNTPLGWAESLGYESPAVKRARKLTAQVSL